MKKLLRLVVVFLILSSASVRSQDLIRTSKDTIKARVTEIGIDEIKYRYFDYQEGPVIVISKKDVIEITYENGRKDFFAPDPYEVNADLTARRKKHAVKVEMLSPLRSNLTFGYEQMIKVGMNIEVKVGIIGIGTEEDYNNPSGFLLKAGIKFLTSSQYVQRGVKYYHGLKGWYLKPEFIFNAYRADVITYDPYLYYPSQQTKNFTNLGFNIIWGFQHVLGKVITIDYYGGIGYARELGDNIRVNDYYDYDRAGYGYSRVTDSQTPLILTGGITIGVLF